MFKNVMILLCVVALVVEFGFSIYIINERQQELTKANNRLYAIRLAVNNEKAAKLLPTAEQKKCVGYDTVDIIGNIADPKISEKEYNDALEKICSRQSCIAKIELAKSSTKRWFSYPTSQGPALSISAQ